MSFITAPPTGNSGSSLGGFLLGLGNTAKDILSAKELAKIEEAQAETQLELFRAQAAITQASTSEAIKMAGAVGVGLIALGGAVAIGKSLLT